MPTPPPLTTGTYWVDTPCPRCGALTAVSLHLGSVLSTPDDAGASLRLVARSKAVDHYCGAHPLVRADATLFDDEHDPEERRYPT